MSFCMQSANHLIHIKLKKNGWKVHHKFCCINYYIPKICLKISGNIFLAIQFLYIRVCAHCIFNHIYNISHTYLKIHQTIIEESHSLGKWTFAPDFVISSMKTSLKIRGHHLFDPISNHNWIIVNSVYPCSPRF